MSVTAYQVMIKTSTSTVYSESAANCDGSDSGIILVMNYNDPLTTLIADPFNLPQEIVVQVKIIAINSVGSSASSFDNTRGALIELIPHKPPTSPLKNASTT